MQTNQEILKFPNVFFFAFFRPKVFIEAAIKLHWKAPISVILIELLTLVFLPVTSSEIGKVLATFKFSNIGLFLVILSIILIFKLTILFLYMYFLQKSFIQHDLNRITSNEELEGKSWYKNVGFYNILFIYFAHSVVGLILLSLIFDLRPALTELPLKALLWLVLLVLLSVYYLYVNLLTLKMLFNKKSFVETFFWQWGKSILASTVTAFSLFGILLIPFIWLNAKHLKNLYPTDGLITKRTQLDNVFIIIPVVSFIFLSFGIYYLGSHLKDMESGFKAGSEAALSEKSRLQKIKELNPKFSDDQILYLDEVNQSYKKSWSAAFNKDPRIKNLIKDYPELMAKTDLAWVIDFDGNLINGTEKILKSSGYSLIDGLCLLNIRQASPYPIPPDSIKKTSKDNKIHINFQFNYNVYKNADQFINKMD